MKLRWPHLIWIGQFLVLLPPSIVWYQQWQGQFDNLNLLGFFPLLGMLAFSIMWYHFFVATIKRLKPNLMNFKKYYRMTGNVVLALILLHPGLLLIAEYQGGFTTLDYVGPKKHLYYYFALIAWSIFILYEIVDRLREKPLVKKHWDLISNLNRLGFILIYFHGLNLGQHLQNGFLRNLWLFYGATTFFFIAHGLWYQYSGRSVKS